MVATRFLWCYHDHMEKLDRLEESVDRLLGVLRYLKEENAHLQDQLAQFDQEKSVLEKENESLKTAMLESERLLETLLQRIDNLLEKVIEHDSIG